MSPQPSALGLSASGEMLCFERSDLTFLASGLSDVFAAKNNKTLRETIAHRRYQSLAAAAHERYSVSLDTPLGLFVTALKARGDSFYRKFLNSHGDGVFCQFRMANTQHKMMKGLYLYTCGLDIVYIGRSFDPFGKRVDQGYGKIHPKNCFIDGQSTNCHLNALIETNREDVLFYVCPLADDAFIEHAERELIQTNRPAWNIALAR